MFFTTSGRCLRRAGARNSRHGPRRQRPQHRESARAAQPRRKSPRPSAFSRRESGHGPNTEDETWDEDFHIVFATRSGIVKKSNLSDFSNIRKGGIIAIQIEEDDCLIDAKLTNGDNEIVLITHEGMSIRFHEEEMRDQGRNTVGVWGIRPEKGDLIVAIARRGSMRRCLLVAGENGIGKRTPFDDYRMQKRGGKGIITMKTGDKTGGVVGALTVTENDELMLITNKGQMVRTRVKEIRAAGRNTMGVKLMDLRGRRKTAGDRAGR